VLCAAFLLLHFGGKALSIKRCSRKMLMKLTPRVVTAVAPTTDAVTGPAMVKV